MDKKSFLIWWWRISCATSRKRLEFRALSIQISVWCCFTWISVWCCFITDYYNYLAPLMTKSSSRVIFHASTNDAVTKDCILNELLELKSYFTERFPECEFIISCPTIRTDNHTTNITIRKLCCKLNDLKTSYYLPGKSRYWVFGEGWFTS